MERKAAGLTVLDSRTLVSLLYTMTCRPCYSATVLLHQRRVLADLKSAYILFSNHDDCETVQMGGRINGNVIYYKASLKNSSHGASPFWAPPSITISTQSSEESIKPPVQLKCFARLAKPVTSTSARTTSQRSCASGRQAATLPSPCHTPPSTLSTSATFYPVFLFSDTVTIQTCTLAAGLNRLNEHARTDFAFMWVFLGQQWGDGRCIILPQPPRPIASCTLEVPGSRLRVRSIFHLDSGEKKSSTHSNE